MPHAKPMLQFCKRRWSMLVTLAVGAAWQGAPAQEAPAAGRPFAIQPYVSLTETITDNATLTTSGQADYITRPTFGVRATADSARLRGYLDYSLSGLLYGRGTARNELQNALSAYGTGELVDKRVFVDIAGSISQQELSAFGTLAPDNSVANPNRVEVSTFLLSPYVHGKLGSAADYEARLSYTGTHTNSSVASNNSSASASLGLNGGTPLTQLGWSTQLSHTETDFSLGRRTDADVARGVMRWTATPELVLSAIGGSESNNYVSADRQTHSITGFGIDWRPSERTALSVEREQRFFGASHTVTFAYRTPRTVWTFSDVRDVSTTPEQTGVQRLGGTNFQIVDQFFSSQETDPILRSALVNAYFQQNPLVNPGAEATATFLRSAVTLQRAQNLTFTILGLRDTVTFAAVQSENRELDTVILASRDFGGTTVIRQRGVSAEWSHRLTPLYALSLRGAYDRNSGSLDSQTILLKSLAAEWNGRLGPRTDLSLGLRHARFSSTTSPYRESAAYGTIRLTF